MSGSRAIVLSLSVRDADVVRQQLVQMGEQGETALQRLDAAAQRTASRGGVTALSQSAREAGDNTGRLGQVMGQAGFQIQDFASQVSSGQSALVAFSQQGSQLLGIFGTGGAIAGAVLTVGILAAQLSGLGQSGETAAEAMKRLGDEMDAATRQAAELLEFINRVNERFLTAGENARIRTLRSVGDDIGRAEQELQGRIFAAANLARQVDAIDADIRALPQTFRQPDGAMDTSGGFGSPDPAQQSEAERRLRSRRDQLQQDIQDLVNQSRRIEFDLNRLRGLQRGIIEDGTNANTGRPDREASERPERPERVDMSEVNAQIQEFRNLAADRDRFIRDNETALERYNRRIDEITALAAAARLNGNPIPEETIRRATEAALADFERMEQATERTSQFANQLGFSFSSAFEDAIIKGKSFSDVLKGLEQDIARIILRASVTQPLGNALAGGVNSLMGSFSFGNLFAGPSGAGSGNTFATVAATGGTFAMGGIMTPNGPLPLNRYALGGIADSPQIALFGEGRTPEAYVPLPDGRRIPVAMQGGASGVSFAPTYNIDARGADASMLPRLRAEMVAIARASNAELLDSIQRGGSAARIVGRRA